MLVPSWRGNGGLSFIHQARASNRTVTSPVPMPTHCLTISKPLHLTAGMPPYKIQLIIRLTPLEN